MAKKLLKFTYYIFLLFLSNVLIFEAQAEKYIFNPHTEIELTYLKIPYYYDEIHFPKAPVSITGRDRVSHYWVLAQATEVKPSMVCKYILIDGITPERLDKPIRKILYFSDDVEIYKNCGKGYKLFTQEIYNSVFYIYYEKERGEPIANQVIVNLADSFAKNVIKAFHGKRNVQRKFDAAFKRNPSEFNWQEMKFLKPAFAKYGVNLH
jgi:hypothetical protein